VADQENDFLREAVARNAGIVLSLPSLGMLRHYKSRFLAEVDGQIIVESAPAEFHLIDELIANATNVGISFKSGPTKVVFGSPITERIDDWRMNDNATIHALRMQWPGAIQSIQRRSNYRVRVGADAELTARVWRIAPRKPLADVPPTAAEIPAQLLNLSTGGMGVTLSAPEDEPLRIDPADRLRVEITFVERKILMEASLRHPQKVPKDAKTLRAGLEFSDMQSNIDGRQTEALLNKIIGELQRAEVRRARLGMMSA
jgi:c-di-GMP-binding flagellar brake protein YcgR